MNYLGRVGHLRSKNSVRKLGQSQIALHPYFYQLRVALRYVHVNAEGRSSGYPK